SKHEYLSKLRDRYRHAGKKGKTRILNEFCTVSVVGQKMARFGTMVNLDPYKLRMQIDALKSKIHKQLKQHNSGATRR
ncbi:MAG: hypothetical protein KAH23_08825, partial [Kiritimatiellae bacterium]|nr:hypothetical protein [Kiritimatiellia bacterium]